MSITVEIKYQPEYDEYKVLGPDNTEDGAYYTDNLQDAVDTATDMWRDHKVSGFSITGFDEID